MNIKSLFSKLKKSEDTKYVGSFRRSAATTIDMWIVLIMRVVVMQLLSTYWLEAKFLAFKTEFTEHFGTESIKNTPEHIDFVIHSSAFLCAIVFYIVVVLVGAFYHACLNSSAWQGTVGKRLTKIMIVKEDESKISFMNAASHYFLSILPFAFIIYLVSYQLQHQVKFFEALTASELNVFLGISFVIWIQIHLFTKKKTTAYDLICGTILINGKTAAKFPWSKIKS